MSNDMTDAEALRIFEQSDVALATAGLSDQNILRVEHNQARAIFAALLTREAALVAELDAALRRANMAEARVKWWEATVVTTGLPYRACPVEGWGPGEGETVAIHELTPKKLTHILDRLKAADAERDALVAEVGALRGWTLVSDSLPEPHEWVQVFEDDNDNPQDVFFGNLLGGFRQRVVPARLSHTDNEGNPYWYLVHGVHHTRNVTHWRRLSSPPIDAARAEAGSHD